MSMQGVYNTKIVSYDPDTYAFALPSKRGTVNAPCNYIRCTDNLGVTIDSTCTKLVHTKHNDILGVTIIVRDRRTPGEAIVISSEKCLIMADTCLISEVDGLELMVQGSKA